MGRPAVTRHCVIIWGCLLGPVTSSCARNATGPTLGHPRGAAVYTVPLGNGPWGARISSQGSAYVTRPLTDSVARIDVSGPTVLFSFRVGRRPDDVWFNVSGSKAYVTNLDDHTVGVINTATSSQTTTYPVPAGPLRLLLGSGETQLYVTLDDGTVAVLDAGTGTLDTTLSVGGQPNGIALSPDGSRVYVSSTSGTVTEILTASSAIGRTLTIGGTPQDLAVSPDGNTLYTANEAGWVDVRNLQTGARADSIAVPRAFGLALAPDRTELWVTQTPVGTISVIDLATGLVVRTIYTLGAPRHIAFTPDGGIALVANEAGYVQVIP